jgi:hypothetical protein
MARPQAGAPRQQESPPAEPAQRVAPALQVAAALHHPPAPPVPSAESQAELAQQVAPALQVAAGATGLAASGRTRIPMRRATSESTPG